MSGRRALFGDGTAPGAKMAKEVGRVDPALVTVVRVGTGDEALYAPAKRLRTEALLKPVGVQEWFHLDEASQHFVAVGYGHVLGVVLLHEEKRKLHQMVVDPRVRGQGVGRLLVGAVEAHARRRGINEIVLHARHYAVPFYEKLGFAKEGEPFTEVGMDHWVMRKDLAATGDVVGSPSPREPPAVEGELVFRRATAADVGQLTEVINDAYRVEGWFKSPAVNGGNRTNADEVRERAGVDGGDASFIECVVDSARPDHVLACFHFEAREGDESYLGMLSVRRRHQFLGLGARMLDRAEQLTRERGYPYLGLVVVDCRPELVAYYARRGFEVTGGHPWPEAYRYVLNDGCGWISFISMRKPMCADDAASAERL